MSMMLRGKEKEGTWSKKKEEPFSALVPWRHDEMKHMDKKRKCGFAVWDLLNKDIQIFW